MVIFDKFCGLSSFSKKGRNFSPKKTSLISQQQFSFQRFVSHKYVFLAVVAATIDGCSLAGRGNNTSNASLHEYARYTDGGEDSDAPDTLFDEEFETDSFNLVAGLDDPEFINAPTFLPRPRLVMTPEVRRELNRFVLRDRSYIESAVPKYQAYRPRIERIFSRHGLPPELINLAIVESRFQHNARSHKGAVGLWQFMRETAHSFGLRTRGRDERLDPIRSSVAAARYLRFLYGEFKDWHLALAAYNTGQGRLAKALDRVGTDDFWQLARSGELARETAEFVPRFIAITMIMKNPEAYGFERFS